MSMTGMTPGRLADRRTGMQICAMAGFIVALGCSGASDVTGPVGIHDPARIYDRLELSYHAITLSLAPGLDTMTLYTTTRTPTGDVFVTDSAIPPVTFRVGSNNTAVRVTSEGLLTAQRVTSRVLIIASQTIGAVTLVDTAVVTITNLAAPPAGVTSITMQPLAGDSAKVDCGGRYTDTLRARALNASGAPIALTVSAGYRSSNPTIATISPTGEVVGQTPGTVTLSMDSYFYGRGVHDTVHYTVGEPLLQVVWLSSRTSVTGATIDSYSTPGDVTIGIGGSVYWLNASDEQVDIVFDDSASAKPSAGTGGNIYVQTGVRFLNFGLTDCPAQGSGNISPLALPSKTSLSGVPFAIVVSCAGVGSRAFTQAGTYTYHSTRTRVTGSIVVR